MAPADHGIVGYRMRVPGDLVLNILRWRTAEGDARDAFPPGDLQPLPAFLGRPTPVVTRAEFSSTGFTTALGITQLHGWHAPSSIAVEVGNLLADGEPLVYAYYDSVDRIAHAHGFDSHYDAELVAADGLVAAIRDTLPPGAVLVVTADHGQVEVGDRLVLLDERLMADTALISGESRFTWLHARRGCVESVMARSRQLYERTGLAAVLTRRSVIDAGWFGGSLSAEVADRLGDVALVARQPVAFLDPGDLRSSGLRCRHGSLTADEMLVPLLAVGST
jgi:predicted AlkP superfamily pyrophosphatase or phosphodiesterase